MNLKGQWSSPYYIYRCLHQFTYLSPNCHIMAIVTFMTSQWFTETYQEYNPNLLLYWYYFQFRFLVPCDMKLIFQYIKKRNISHSIEYETCWLICLHSLVQQCFIFWLMADIWNYLGVKARYTRFIILNIIIWYLNLQLHMQSVPITAQVVSLNPTHVLDTTLCDKVC